MSVTTYQVLPTIFWPSVDLSRPGQSVDDALAEWKTGCDAMVAEKVVTSSTAQREEP